MADETVRRRFLLASVAVRGNVTAAVEQNCWLERLVLRPMAEVDNDTAAVAAAVEMDIVVGHCSMAVLCRFVAAVLHRNMLELMRVDKLGIRLLFWDNLLRDKMDLDKVLKVKGSKVSFKKV